MERHTRERSGIRLDRELRWWHDGQLVEHPRIVEAFNRGLKPDADGRFRLELGDDWCWVQVEEAAYAVALVDVLGPGALGVRLSDRTSEPLDVSSLSVGEDGVLRARVKEGRAIARFSRDAQFALGELVAAGEGGAALLVGGQAVALPPGVGVAFAPAGPA